MSRVLPDRIPPSAHRVLRAVYPSTARPAFWWEAGQATGDYGEPASPDWREVDWPRHLHRAKVAGREVNYVDIGEGEAEPVVFIHGLGGNWQNWLENIPCAAQHRRVIAVDLPGFGESEMPADKISISGYGRWVEELLDQAQVERAALVGNSMGGFIATEMAISYPQRVERLVLAAAAGISSANVRRFPVMSGARVTAALGTMTAARNREVVSRPRLRHLALSTVIRHPTRLRADLLHELILGAGKPGFISALDALTSYDFRDRLPEVGCPTLLVWGAEDILVPVEDADEFERLIPDARKVLFDETGHAPMLERPREFNDCLMKFLEAADADGPGERDAAEAVAGAEHP